MQYSSLFLAALSATGTLAAPMGTAIAAGNHSIQVLLQNQATESGAGISFTEGALPQQLSPSQFGPFETLLLTLGADVNPQTLRCKAIDDLGNPIVGLRGENVDITFGDGGNGAWTFRKPTIVSSVICDPTFVKTDKSENNVRVQLSGPGELATQTEFTGAASETKPPVGSNGPYDTIELDVGILVEDQGIRCKVLDNNGKEIIAVRGANTDTTFSDAGKGAWAFQKASEVSQIICDPAFVAAPL
ncbi:hypothetical protein K491DRAFT_761267 [Lophiostoma macrostomum CBS 122681]|uniref:Ubiquitin 3 binding protein But2 C-terminal domain-containing protein n=1 Tax=Lophiostoma macrostomum CBS 122681 TaxID=1314788 RepID=A0A6A6SX34_9PLEO|nr:hypothetical protein K491DRAFT_761267 [Lophiostoma macrostomum CBS 122681]